MNKIMPIPISQLMIERSLMTYRMGFGQTEPIYTTMWLIEGPKERILVDTGCDAPTASQFGFQATQVVLPGEGLAKHRLKVEDIDVLILTHMHFDHMEFTRQFTRAKVIVQRDEYDFAINPHPYFAKGFIKEMFPEPKQTNAVVGDTEIAPGVRVFLTPGHTPGGQSVSVETEKGEVVICGLCGIQDNLYPPAEKAAMFPVIPPGIHTDVMQAYDSLSLIKSRSKLVISLHDPTVCLKDEIP